MASKYWIKLYHEILDDDKMGTLPADCWRFCVELFLYAGEVDCNGTLPNVTKIAWRLRYNVTQVETWLNQLSEIGITTYTENGWIVTNFVKRQAKNDTNQRVTEFRKRQKQRNGNENGNNNVTKMKRNVTPDTDIDIDKDINTIKPGEVGTRVLEVCKLDYDYVQTDEKLRTAMVNTLGYLAKKNITANQVVEFEKWRKVHHWTKANAPSFKQVAEFWPQYEEWVSNGKPEQPPPKGNGTSESRPTPPKTDIDINKLRLLQQGAI